MGYYFMPGMSIDDEKQSIIQGMLLDEMLSKLEAPTPLPIPILKSPLNDIDMELTKGDLINIEAMLRKWGIDTTGFLEMYGLSDDDLL